MRGRRKPRTGRSLAGISLAVSVAVGVAAVWDAIVLQTTAAELATTHPQRAPLAAPGNGSLERILTVVEVDPFHPERRAPERRFGAAEETTDAPPSTELRLAGTGLLPQGGDFVLAGFGAESPRIVRVGESIGAYRLVTVRPGEADFRVGGSAGERITVSVSRPGS